MKIVIFHFQNSQFHHVSVSLWSGKVVRQLVLIFAAVPTLLNSFIGCTVNDILYMALL